MEFRNYGTTGLKVSVIGFGAGEIGDYSVPENQAEKILNTALDSGINLIDTARGYFASEERIGKFLSHRRKEFVLSTKVGYGIQGFGDWTYDIIIVGVDEALRLMRTDYIDIVHLHSCDVDILRRGEVIDALDKTVEAGKVRFAAYSGDNEAVDFAVGSGRFQGIQTSINLTDQRNLYSLLPDAMSKGLGIIAKRPLANAPWRFNDQPFGHYCEDYWLRWKKMNYNPDIEWGELFLRFVLSIQEISSAIIGTVNPDHLKENIEIAARGSLPKNVFKDLVNIFRKNDNNWVGLT
ncbi:MAG: aldo/keto reductase [Ignavibacteriaceae bacterium]|nr:aldo/keto reductase [Ignavibacteriaceae bacterium]